MSALKTFVVGLALSTPAISFAGTAEIPGIRAVTSETTDIFQVISTLNDAKAALEQREYTQARKRFESVLMHDANLSEARTGLRRTLIALGEFTEARQWIDTDDSADSLIIDVLSGQNQTPEIAIKAALQTENDPRLWTLLGKVHDQSGKHASARQAYAMAGLAGARPGLADNNIGHSHWLEGNADRALNSFERATSADAGDIQFDNNRRRALISLGQTHDAVSGLNATRAGLFLAQAGDHAASSGDVKLAAFLYRKSLDLSPRHNPAVAAQLRRLTQGR